MATRYIPIFKEVNHTDDILGALRFSMDEIPAGVAGILEVTTKAGKVSVRVVKGKKARGKG
jgi:hypothetical protein